MSASTMRLLSCWLGAATLTATAGCDSEGPSGPDYEMGHVLPQFYTVGGSEGTKQIGIPADNSSANNSGAVNAFEIVTASKYDFVQITISGTVSSSHAGYCSPPEGPAGTWDAFGAPGGGLRVEIETSPNIGGLPASSPPGPKVVNFPVGQNISVRAKRVGLVAGCSAGPGLNLGGTQTIQYEVYPFYKVEATPGWVPVGDTITFTSSSHWTTTSKQWRYMEGDTTATPTANWRAKYVCASGDTCKYAPAKSGRMYQTGTFPLPSGGTQWMPGPIVWVGVPRAFTLNVTARDSSITRGDTLTFSVKNTGSGGELNSIDLAWAFEPDSVKYYENSVSPRFAPPPRSGALTDSTFFGTIVHPGRLIISGQMGSGGSATTHADTVVLTVGDRTTDAPTLVIHQDSIQTALIDIPTVSTTIWEAGQLHTLGGVYGNLPLTPSGVTPVTVPGGPNEGYVYIEDAMYTMHRSYSFNPWILNPGDLYDGGLTTWQYVISRGGDPQLFFNKTLQHEVGAVPTSHAGRQEVAANSFKSCGNLSQAVERLVAGTGTLLANMISAATGRAEDAVWYLSDHTYVNGFQSSPNPVAEWDSRRPDIRDGLTDYPGTTSTAPDPSFCDISGI